jgi:hypothetical protein
MMENPEIMQLAETLRKNGIAATDMDAKQLAKNMIEGSRQVNDQHERYAAERKKRPEVSPVASSPEEKGTVHVDDVNIETDKKNVDELQERVRNIETAVGQKDVEVTELRDRVQNLEHEINDLSAEEAADDVREQEDVLASETPLNELMTADDSPQQTEAQEVATEIVDIPKEPESDPEGDEMAEEMLEPQFHVSSEDDTQDISAVEADSQQDQESYRDEQEELGFLGESASAGSINTDADAPATTQEIPVTQDERSKRGIGLSPEEKDSTDLSKIFNFSNNS